MTHFCFFGTLRSDNDLLSQSEFDAASRALLAKWQQRMRQAL